MITMAKCLLLNLWVILILLAKRLILRIEKVEVQFST